MNFLSLLDLESHPLALLKKYWSHAA